MNWIKVSNLSGRMGHQIAEWNTALIIAEYYNLELIHTPLNYGWEKNLNFGKSFGNLNNISPKNIIKLPKFNRANIEEIRPYIENKSDTLFLLASGQNLESHWLSEKTLKNLWIDSPINKPFKPDTNKIGVHIRRGDVTQRTYPERWVDNSVYVEILNKEIEKDSNLEVHIFTEGNTNQFKELMKYNPTFHINGSEFETFNKMTKCEILVTGKSGYSYFASIISDNDIIAIPFWHDYPTKKRINKYEFK